MKYDDGSFIWLKAKFKIKIASVVLCYFTFPPGVTKKVVKKSG